MNNIYKIEAYCEASIKQLADFIAKSGSKCVVRGWAVITDHVFTETETDQALHLVARISDNLTDDDLYYWSMNDNKQAA
ncbi:hypothetical protein R3X26_13105 [Vibrio sp. TH_r3]|uniref:hypothetical protein n=1 Tax=unclassified Vibrio TaxID=2614977 RepID=UPI00295382C7|nr:hypothetical protein [Vibrio sp. TH_r3]MDV7105343.1 hypothetical protein [Vibrio sp. TH_r3]